MEEFRELFLLIKEYIQKQKENLSLGAAESMTRLLFALALGLMLFLLGSIVLLLGSFALAFWINDAMDSTVMGFAILAAAILLLTIILWLMRRQWVLQPIARLMVQIFISTDVPKDNNQSSTQK
ncbi:MAG: phage holin family protein [Bacteroidaceae bacterium]|nr:phage holin family protein [Bacteroidaceae bacterium]